MALLSFLFFSFSTFNFTQCFDQKQSEYHTMKIVRYFLDLERRMSHVSHTIPIRIESVCLSSPPYKTSMLSSMRFSRLPWRPVLPQYCNGVGESSARFTDFSISSFQQLVAGSICPPSFLSHDPINASFTYRPMISSVRMSK